jgi:hypothetical protein
MDGRSVFVFPWGKREGAPAAPSSCPPPSFVPSVHYGGESSLGGDSKEGFHSMDESIPFPSKVEGG